MAYLSLGARICIVIFTVVGVFLASLTSFFLLKKDGSSRAEDNEQGSGPESGKQRRDSAMTESSTCGYSTRTVRTYSVRIQHKRARMPEIREVERHQGYVLHEGNPDTKTPQVAEIDNHFP
ncbi:hypothetical protein GGS21DRAFT_489568 [Xylaria nigripes]|nr:hypothetical protein GGS21DRAFT_489568 [Xylaria nigripes]